MIVQGDLLDARVQYRAFCAGLSIWCELLDHELAAAIWADRADDVHRSIAGCDAATIVVEDVA